MEILYFKTTLNYYLSIGKNRKIGNTVDVCNIECKCGETAGALVYDKTMHLCKQLILCDTCYDHSRPEEKGE